MPKGPMIAQTHCLITCATEQHQKKWSRVCLHRCRQAKRRQQSADMCKQTSLSAHVCRQCADKIFFLHMCADKLQTKPDKLQTKPDKLQTNCRQCQTNLSAVCVALSAVCPHTCADTQIYLQIVCTFMQTNQFVCTLSAHMCRQTSLSPHCLHTCADKLVCPQLIQEHTGSLQLLFCTCGPDKNRANLVCKKKVHFDVYICIALYSYL